MKKSKKTTLKTTVDIELMTFLMEKLEGKSRNNIKSLLVHRQVSINNRAISQYNHIVKAGQEVVIDWNKQRVENNNFSGLEILFEDEHIIVALKPSGMLSIATNKERTNTAYNILKTYLKEKDESNKIFIVHRLDQGTSGVMIFSKSEEAQQILQSEWKKKVKERIYVAVVEGNVQKEQNTVISYLAENKAFVTYSTKDESKGKKAVTHYKVIKKNKKYSLLELKLGTGRKNQIRCHMMEEGHSIIGDKKYGATGNPIKRLGLHALSIEFFHPITNKLMKFDTRIPAKFSQLVR
jgi:23S rRNA pseudouridine1911/1915/1917 synthase